MATPSSCAACRDESYRNAVLDGNAMLMSLIYVTPHRCFFHVANFSMSGVAVLICMRVGVQHAMCCGVLKVPLPCQCMWIRQSCELLLRKVVFPCAHADPLLYALPSSSTQTESDHNQVHDVVCCQNVTRKSGCALRNSQMLASDTLKPVRRMPCKRGSLSSTARPCRRGGRSSPYNVIC